MKKEKGNWEKQFDEKWDFWFWKKITKPKNDFKDFIRQEKKKSFKDGHLSGFVDACEKLRKRRIDNTKK